MSSSKKYIVCLLLVLSFLFPTSVSAAVLINEFSASTDPEWIELYNDGNVAVDLTGYTIVDNNGKDDDLLLSGIIEAGGFLVFNHSEGWLNNGGDIITLLNNASPSAVVDKYEYKSSDSNKSIARIPNGSDSWISTTEVTMGQKNPSPTPTPTPTNSPTPLPTQSPTSSPTLKPTQTPTPTPVKTSSPKPTLSPSPEPVEENVESEEPQDLLQVSEDNSDLQPKVLGEKTEKNMPLTPLVLIISGVILLGYCGYILYNQRHAAGQKDS